ncbi:MAG: hypothetical protein R8J94_21445 [Acidimicrobiia bacterium]|nr:hypothetical protein [Acidimicrobiia bacterium]
MVILGLAGTGDVINLPAWTDIKGVDIPLIGDTDAIDCRLRRVDDTTMVRINVVDGDETTYASYVHVWNNGNLVDPEQIERIADDEFIVPSTPGAVEQFYSISIEPLREGRVFCESINIE